MKIEIIYWDSIPPSRDPYLLRVPYEGFDAFSDTLKNRDNPPMGLLPPITGNPSFNARTMSTVRDFFPAIPTFAPIFPTEGREFLRAARGVAFRHFALAYVEPFNFFYHAIHDLLAGMTVHVAGGNPSEYFPTRQMPEGWTWSEEGLV